MGEKAIIMLGTAGLMTAEKILNDRRKELARIYSERYLRDIKILLETEMKKQKEYLSVKEMTSFSTFVSCGADGIFGALWKLGEELDTGLCVELKNITIDQHVIELCDFVDINPYEEADSTGSHIFTVQNPGETLSLLSAHGINASLIGYTTKERARTVVGDTVRYLKGNLK